MEDVFLFVLRLCNDGFTIEVVSLFGIGGTGPSLVHECQVSLHLRSREHVDCIQLERLHDVLLDPVIQAHARGSLEDDSCPVNVDAIFPSLAWLVYT